MYLSRGHSPFYQIFSASSDNKTGTTFQNYIVVKLGRMLLIAPYYPASFLHLLIKHLSHERTRLEYFRV